MADIFWAKKSARETCVLRAVLLNAWPQTRQGEVGHKLVGKARCFCLIALFCKHDLAPVKPV
jgi:hypothetical protein